MKIFLHTRSPGQRDWNNTVVEVPQIPAVGEYVATSGSGDDWYQVELVLHTPFPCEFDAEVYSVAKNHLDAMEEAFKT